MDPAAVLSDVERALGAGAGINFPSLEELITSPDGFGLTTATPVQRAVYRIAEGRPLGDLATHPLVIEALGGVAAVEAVEAGGPAPKEFYLIAAIRTAKSIFAGALAVRATQIVDISHLGAGETPRISILSTSKDNADIVFNHIVGNVLAHAALKALVVGEPKANSITLRHPSGRPIEIKVVAGARAGATLVGRWCAGVIFDEAPRMVGADDGVVNFEHAHAAVIGRLLPGAQLVGIGSPWAPFGPIYKIVQERFGKPSRDLVLLRATGPMMNPVYWTPAQCEWYRVNKPEVHKTDVLGEFADPESALFASEELIAAERKTPLYLTRERDGIYTAAMDPATRRNAWSFVIAQALPRERRIRIAFAHQWIPYGEKLNPLSVLQAIAGYAHPYGIESVYSDGWSADAIDTLAGQVGLAIIDQRMAPAEKVEAYDSFHVRVANGTCELPPMPELRSDLLSVRKKVKQSGFEIVLPLTGDGRHADYAPAIVLAVREAAKYLDDGVADYMPMGVPSGRRGLSTPSKINPLYAGAVLQQTAEEREFLEDGGDPFS